MGGTEDFVAVSCGFLSRVALFSDQRKKRPSLSVFLIIVKKGPEWWHPPMFESHHQWSLHHQFVIKSVQNQLIILLIDGYAFLKRPETFYVQVFLLLVTFYNIFWGALASCGGKCKSCGAMAASVEPMMGRSHHTSRYSFLLLFLLLLSPQIFVLSVSNQFQQLEHHNNNLHIVGWHPLKISEMFLPVDAP